MKQVQLVCLKCKNTFEGHKSRKFCSRSCSASYNNKGTRRHKGDLPTCGFCNKKLPEINRKYCNPKCQASKQKIHKWHDIENGLVKSPIVLKKYLIEKFGHECSICKITQWMQCKAPLVLDHIDGNANNNLPINLRLVCGNCDMQLPTYKSKNKGKGRAYRRERYANGQSY